MTFEIRFVADLFFASFFLKENSRHRAQKAHSRPLAPTDIGPTCRHSLAEDKMQGDDRHGHVRQTRATAVDKRLQQLHAHTHCQDNSKGAGRDTAGHAYEPASQPRPALAANHRDQDQSRLSTAASFHARFFSFPDLQQAKGRRDKMQGDDRHGHVRQTRATAVDKRLQQLQADGRRPRSFSPARTHTHGQGKSCADARPPPDWKTYGAWSASCPHDLQQAKGRRDKMHGDDRHGRRPRGANTWNVAQTLATAVDKRLQQLKSEGRRTRSFSPARTGAHGQDTSKPCCGLHDKGNAYELALWKSCEGTFRRHSVSAIDLVKMREAARALWNTPRTCTCSLNSPPQRDERPSAPLQAGRANMMPCTRSPVELASSVMRLMHIVVAFFFAVVSFLTLMLPSFSALTSPLWGPRSKLADSQWQRPQRARG